VSNLTEEKSSNKKQSRRTFLKYAGGAVVVAAVGAGAYYVGSQTAPATAPPTTSMMSSTTGSAGAPVTLNVMKSPHTSSDPEFFKTYEDQFVAQHPGTTIVHTVPGWGDLPTTLTSSIAGGNAPDVAYLPTRFIYQWANAGALAALGDLTTSDVISSWQQQFVGPMWTAALYKGKPYGLPYLSVARELIYNVDLLNKAGISTPPQTWDDFYTAAKKTTDPANGVYGYGVGLGEESFTMDAWIWQAGGDYLIVKADGTTWSGLDSPQCLQAATFVQKLYKDGLALTPSGVGWDQISSAVYAGKLAMTPFEPFSFSPDIMSKYPNVHLGVSGALIGPDTDDTDIGHYRAAYFDQGSWCVFKQSRNPQLAWALAQQLAGQNCESAYVMASGLFPTMSALSNIFASDPKEAFFNAFQTDPVHLKYGRAPSAWDVNAKAVANSPYAAAVESVMEELETDLAVVKMDPATALAKAHSNCNGVLSALGAH
jgi:ABC-type glycerol-3-phosphate transport system substrate-binding protein